MSTHAYAPSRRGTIYLTCLSDTPFDLMVPSRQVIKVRSGLEVVLGPRALSDAISAISFGASDSALMLTLCALQMLVLLLLFIAG